MDASVVGGGRIRWTCHIHGHIQCLCFGPGCVHVWPWTLEILSGHVHTPIEHVVTSTWAMPAYTLDLFPICGACPSEHIQMWVVPNP
jgi:hypothetical protein